MPAPDKGAAKQQPSKAVIIRSLQQVLEEKQRMYEQLLEENVSLRTRETVLLQQVTQQGDNLHFVALAASQTETAGMPEMAKTLMQDLEVYELLQLLGRSENRQGDEPFTTQRLRAAVTPERVAAMRNTTVEEVAAHLKQLTMRMCMLLSGGPSKAHLFSDSIEAVVNEYGEYGLLLHVVADWVSLQIGTLNLDTLQVQEPPPGYWELVVDNLELMEQQIQTLATGFNSYQQKSKPIITALHSTVSSIQGILDADESADSGQSPHSGNGAGPGERPFLHVLHNSLDGGAGGKAGTAQTMDCSGLSTAPSDPSSAPAASAPHGRVPASSVGNGSLSAVVRPWQQFGLTHGCLTVETAEVLEQHMNTLLQLVMKLREQHRTVTWLFLNTLNARQHALFITGSWPWWSRPLTMCQYVAEQHSQQHRSSQRQSTSRSSGGGAGGGGAVTTPSPGAAAVTEGVNLMTLGCCPMQFTSLGPAAVQQQEHLQQLHQQQHSNKHGVR